MSSKRTANGSLTDRLNPMKLGFSPRMAYLLQAMTGFDYGVRDGKAGYAGSLSITSDEFLIASSSAHESGSFLGDASDLGRNLSMLLADAQLTPKEVAEFSELKKSHVSDWRR